MEQATGSKEHEGRSCVPVLALILLIGLVAVGTPSAIFYFVSVRDQQMHETDERKFDPIDGYAQASRLAEGQKDLVSMRARFVRPDGTMDLSAEYSPTVTYRWRERGSSKDQRPIGAGGGGSTIDVVDVEVNDFGLHKTGQMGPETFYRFDLGFRRIERAVPLLEDASAAATPNCKLSKLWDHALAQGAPENAVALIHYDASGYTFEIENTDVRMKFDASCKPI